MCLRSLLIGVFNFLFGKDPMKDLATAQHKAAKPVGITILMELIWKMMKIPTFALIIVQVGFQLLLFRIAAGPWLNRDGVISSTHKDRAPVKTCARHAHSSSRSLAWKRPIWLILAVCTRSCTCAYPLSNGGRCFV